MSTISDLVVGMRLDPRGFSQGLGVARRQVIAFNRSLAGAGAAFAAMKLGGILSDSANLAARYQTLGVVLGVVGRNAGKSRAEMDALVDSISGPKGVSLIEARANLIKMAQSHLDLSKAVELSRAAQNAAVIANINSSEAFARVVHGIQSGRTVVLRQIGIMVNFEQAYRRAAAQLGRTKNQMSETERANIRMNETLRATKIIAGVYEAAFYTVGKQLLSTQRYLENMKVKVGTAFLPEYTLLVAGYGKMLAFVANNARAAASVIAGLAAAFGVLSAVLLGKALIAFMTFLSLPALPVLGALAAVAAVVGALTYTMAKGAEQARKYADALEAMPEAALKASLADVQARQQSLLAANPDIQTTGEDSFLRRAKKNLRDDFRNLGIGKKLTPQEVFDALERRRKELNAALAAQKLSGQPTDDGSGLPGDDESKAALRRLQDLEREAPIFIAGQNAIRAAYNNVGLAAGQYQEHLAEVREAQEQAARGLKGANAARARELEGNKQNARWLATVAQKTRETIDANNEAEREAAQRLRAIRLVGRAVEEEAISREYLNKVIALEKTVYEGMSSAEKDSVQDSLASARALRDQAFAALDLERALRPAKVAFEGLSEGLFDFFGNLVTDGAGAFRQFGQMVKNTIGNVVKEFARQKLEVTIIPKLAGLLGLNAEPRMQTAANTNLSAAQVMLTASINNMKAAGIWTGPITSPPVGGTGVAGAGASLGTKLLGGAGIALSAFSIGQMAGGLSGSKIGATALGGLSGAAAGALIGSIIPGIGTLVGGVIGGLAGMIGGWFGRKKKPPVELDTLIKGLEFDSTKVASLAELRKRQADIQKKLAGSLDLGKRIEYEERLKQINEALKGATDAVNGFGQAMYNIPDIFKVALAGFDARFPEYPTPTAPPTGGGSGGGEGAGGPDDPFDWRGDPKQGNVYQISINAMDRSISEVFDEVEMEARRRSLARYGSSAGVGLVRTPTGSF